MLGIRIAAAVAFALGAFSSAHAGPIPFSTTESSPYLLIGMMAGVNAAKTGQAVDTDNFELGANKAPTPSHSGFASGSSGPGLLYNVPHIPLNALPVETNIGGHGNIAITHDSGVIHLSDVGVYADREIGIRCAQSVAGCAYAGISNSYFNDPWEYPNSFTPGPGLPGTNNVGGSGVKADPGHPSHLISAGNGYPGMTGGVDFDPLLAELAAAANLISNPSLLATTATLHLPDGYLKKELDTFTVTGSITVNDIPHNNISGDPFEKYGNTIINLAPGLNVIDINTYAKDFVLENSNLVIQGGKDSFAIFRFVHDVNFKISQANILVGDGGIGLNNVLFYSDRPDSNQHFDFSKTVLNGVAFWTLAGRGGQINIDNAQGCVQLVADEINLNDVRFNRCAFGTTQVPEPGTLLLFAPLLLALAALRRRKPL